MKNFRIFLEDNKKCEAIWLEYLLVLCGGQVWKGKLSLDNLILHGNTSRHRYIDILLFSDIDWRFCSAIADHNMTGSYFVSGKRNGADMPPGVYTWGFCRELDINNPKTLLELIDYIFTVITEEQQEREAIIRLAENYVSDHNLLMKSIYVITELFCSRRLNYTRYKGIDTLIYAINNVQKWYDKYLNVLGERLAFIEMFTLTWLQNLINEGYIKARQNKGYDRDILLKNANYLKKLKPEMPAVLFLKLQILHNCINCDERLEDIMNQILEKSAPEYVGRAYCEMGDLLRDNEDRDYKHTADEYYGKLDEKDFECYRGVYKLGLLYEDMGERDGKWYRHAEERYDLVLRLIEPIDVMNRTPQEFEYYCKAVYAKIKMQLLQDEIGGTLSKDKKTYYGEELKKLISDCDKFRKGVFINKLYNDQEEDGITRKNVISLMSEKINLIKLWSQNLQRDKL